MRKRHLATLLLAGSLLAAGGAIAAESQVGHTEMGGGSDDVLYSSIESTDAYNEGLERLAQINARQDEINAEYAPEIRTLKDGTQVQRTPTEYQCYHWNRPYSGGISYNNYYLDADHRGCGACHVDLGDTLANMEYSHLTVQNEALGTWITVDQCMLCHSDDDDYEFGTLLHAVHYGTRNGDMFEAMGGRCLSCHNMTENGNGVELWDLVKYSHLDGVVKVSDVQGEFEFEQDNVVAPEDMFTYDWIHTDYDHMFHILGKNGLDAEFDEEAVYNWEITMDGLVNEPYTAKLGDLIAEAEADGAVVTKVSKIVCVDNMPGGGGISNVEITGIPLN